MARIALVLSLVAVATGGYALWALGDLPRRLDAIESGQAQVRADLARATERLDGARREADPPPLRAGEPVDGTRGVAGESDGVTLAGRTPRTLAERLQALEEQITAQQADVERLGQRVAEGERARPQVLRNAEELFMNLDQAAASLGLDPRQKADMVDLLDVAKRDLEDLYKTPNEDGLTWEEARKTNMQKVGTEGGIQIAFPDFAKIRKLMASKVPGTNETFEAAERRIKDGAFGEVRRLLAPKQQEQWDRAHKDGLLGGSATSGAFIALTTGSEVSDD
jgi:hypothetical protein